jgi:hypothetical protein
VDEHDVLVSEGVAQPLAGLVLDVRDADFGAMLSEKANDGFTDTGGTTGDEGDLPFQPVLQKEITIKFEGQSPVTD